MKNNQTKSTRGGKREGAGRKPGAPNKWTGSLRDYARQFTGEAIDTLVSVMRDSDSDAARTAAVNAILDRGYGKPSQVIAGDDEGGPVRLGIEVRFVDASAG